MVRWVGFNCLIGNEDAHAKNLAFLYTEDGLRLAPHYDLVSTEVYGDLTRMLAMKVGTSWDIRNLQRHDWQRLAERVGLPWERVRAVLLEQASRVAAKASQVARLCAERYGPAPMYLRVVDVATRRAAQMSRELGG
jgi:serine/threonine-protein kinase HipA